MRRSQVCDMSQNLRRCPIRWRVMMLWLACHHECPTFRTDRHLGSVGLGSDAVRLPSDRNGLLRQVELDDRLLSGQWRGGEVFEATHGPLGGRRWSRRAEVRGPSYLGPNVNQLAVDLRDQQPYGMERRYRSPPVSGGEAGFE